MKATSKKNLQTKLKRTHLQKTNFITDYDFVNETEKVRNKDELKKEMKLSRPKVSK